ncbi:DNA-methyltransferase [Saccharomonospora piscinae]|uniref:DNA-methyltransferase n=1 Tax=Saccharomonospora piscinae TaxID=687388 RepID=UPI001AEC97B9|nr:site-specific DNA-methyltransferase [Saccharomonospora piscinae]
MARAEMTALPNISDDPALAADSADGPIESLHDVSKVDVPRHELRVPEVPTRASRNPDGTLKDTAANRALHPVETPQEVFASSAIAERAYYSDDRSLVFHGDVSDTLKALAEAGMQVDCIVTSPPFYGQRDYGVDGQIGLEQHPQKFVDSLVDVFELCGPILKETGSLWVNLGDTYWSGKGAHKSNETKQGARRFGVRPQDSTGDGLWARPKQLLLIPHRFAIAMQDSGWLMRNDNVWVKPNPIPDQVRDRCSISHEYVFHMTKERWYYFDREAVGRTSKSGRTLPPLDTWVVPTSRGSKSHKASFSEGLVSVPVLATTPANGVVLDPFGGSGTTLRFARKHGFRSIGVDLNAGYCEEMATTMRVMRKEEQDGPVPDQF